MMAITMSLKAMCTLGTATDMNIERYNYSIVDQRSNVDWAIKPDRKKGSIQIIFENVLSLWCWAGLVAMTYNAIGLVADQVNGRELTPLKDLLFVAGLTILGFFILNIYIKLTERTNDT